MDARRTRADDVEGYREGVKRLRPRREEFSVEHLIRSQLAEGVAGHDPHR